MVTHASGLLAFLKQYTDHIVHSMATFDIKSTSFGLMLQALQNLEQPPHLQTFSCLTIFGGYGYNHSVQILGALSRFLLYVINPSTMIQKLIYNILILLKLFSNWIKKLFYFLVPIQSYSCFHLSLIQFSPWTLFLACAIVQGSNLAN